VINPGSPQAAIAISGALFAFAIKKFVRGTALTSRQLHSSILPVDPSSTPSKAH